MSDTPDQTVCRICGAPAQDHLANVRGHRLVRCVRCRFVQVAHPPDPVALDAIYQEAYFGHHKYRDADTQHIENLRRLELLRRFVADGGRVLEVGCGDGSFLSEAKLHYEMHGFDLSPAGVAIAREKNPDLAGRIRAGRMEDQDIPAEHFDAICMWDVIEHLWDARAASKQLLRSLPSGGVLLLSTPNIGAPVARLMGRHWAFMTPPEHLSFFSRKSMGRLFVDELGADIVEWRSLGKRANIGFILYKARRVFPLLPGFIPRLFEQGIFSKLAVYVPTGDIQYVVIRKR